MTRTILRLLASLALSTALYATPSTSRLLPPSKDPFYAVPDDVENFASGTIFNHRQPPDLIVGFGVQLANLESSHQILYRTTDDEGNATATVVTVLIPDKADFNKVVSYQVAENSASVDCAPSYGFLLSTSVDPLIGSKTMQTQLLLLEGALAEGWVVIVPDHQGPNGAYFTNRLAGRSVLDGIRATLQSTAFTGISKSARVTIWGYSAGASVTQWAAELQPTYAPELKIFGAAIGGGCNSLAVPISRVNNGRVSGFIPIVLVGLSAQYTGLRELINKELKPEFKGEFYKPLHQCLNANLASFEDKDITTFFVNWPRFIQNPVLLKLLGTLNDGKSLSQIPLFWHTATHDEALPIQDMDAAVAEYCARGGTVRYRRDTAPNLRHTNYGVVSTPIAIAWLKEVLNGKAPKPGCSTEIGTTSELDEDFLKLFPKDIADVLAASAGKVGGGI